MTIAEAPENTGTPPEWQSWTSRTWLLIWGSLVAVVLLAAALLVVAKLNSLDDEYGPISDGSSGGLGVSREIAYDRHDNARLVTTGDRTAHVYGSLRNAGLHSVRITGIDSDDVTVGAEWAPIPDENGATVPDSKARWRSFPVTIGAQTEIEMRYTIRRPPHCQDKPMRPGMGEFYSDSHDVRWESLLGDHSTTISGFLDISDTVQVC